MHYQIKFCAMLCLLFATTAVAKADLLNDRGPTAAQLRTIAGWVSANSDLPYALDLPRVEFVPPAQLVRLRYKHLLSDPRQSISGERPSQTIGGEHSTPAPQFQRTVVAIYDDATETIYLPENWNGASRADQSVLVHEMVHHLQNRARMTYGCAGARERPAYLAQKQWLEAHGLDLGQEFQVDMFTVVAMSVCMD
jgi:hypothetical protein